jgi:hypothetical protein
MILANHGIIASSGGVTFDTDAQAFITAASISDSTQQTAINTLVTDLKTYNIWTKMKAIYPFVGGTASTHKWNLKDPRDLDVAHRLTFFGGVTHSSTGITGNVTNGYVNTNWTQNVSGTLNNQAIGVYVRTNNTYTGIDMGARLFNTSDVSLASYGGSPIIGRVNTYSDYVSVSGIPKGFYQVTRVGGSSQTVFLNNTSATSTITTSTAILDRPIYLLALNDSLLGDEYNTNRELAFAYISEGLTNTECTNFNTVVNLFQTTLTRNV